LRWYKVELAGTRANASTIEEILVAIGAISISMTNKSKKDIYEPGVGETPLWELINISALFEQKILEKDIASALNLIEYSNLSISELEETNWIESYQKNFQPIKFGKNLYVIPSWEESNKFDDKTIIRMDPGLAFGSGSHETTHLCLEYLDSSNLKELTVIDYGCGSGILGIATLLLGAKNVIAVDIDPQAIIATKENAKINNVDKKISIVSSEGLADIEADILIANILSNPLMTLRDKFIELIKPNGRIVISGIMKKQLLEVSKHYEEFCTIVDVKERNKWCLIELLKH
jgi:ribosomal protein L11 methyltransferase